MNWVCRGSRQVGARTVENFQNNSFSYTIMASLEPTKVSRTVSSFVGTYVLSMITSGRVDSIITHNQRCKGVSNTTDLVDPLTEVMSRVKWRSRGASSIVTTPIMLCYIYYHLSMSKSTVCQAIQSTSFTLK